MDEALESTERTVPVADLGERLCALRLRDPAAVRSVRGSLLRHGQLTAATAYRSEGGGLELVDGFKRLQAGRELGWTTLRVRALPLEWVEAKAAVVALNRQCGLTELEEGWLVRSLYRDDGLTQPQIGRLLERHKSWVCRRLMLVEQLEDAVQDDVRLGLLAARTAVALARLPHGNQRPVADVVARAGLTTQQTDRLVAALLAAQSDAERQRLLVEHAGGRAGAVRNAPDRLPASPALRIVLDIGQLCRVAARLEARLLERPLCTLGAQGACAVREALAALGPVLEKLQQAVASGTRPRTEV